MANTGGRAQMTTGQRMDDIKASIPGTQAYEARHGYDNAHANMQNLKAHIPGTAEHQNRATAMGGTGTGATGVGGGMGATGTTAHTGTGMGGAGTGYTGTEGMTAGQKIAAAVPGTTANKEKQMAQVDMAAGGVNQPGVGMGTTGNQYGHRNVL